MPAAKRQRLRRHLMPSVHCGGRTSSPATALNRPMRPDWHADERTLCCLPLLPIPASLHPLLPSLSLPQLLPSPPSPSPPTPPSWMGERTSSPAAVLPPPPSSLPPSLDSSLPPSLLPAPSPPFLLSSPNSGWTNGPPRPLPRPAAAPSARPAPRRPDLLACCHIRPAPAAGPCGRPELIHLPHAPPGTGDCTRASLSGGVLTSGSPPLSSPSYPPTPSSISPTSPQPFLTPL